MVGAYYFLTGKNTKRNCAAYQFEISEINRFVQQNPYQICECKENCISEHRLQKTLILLTKIIKTLRIKNSNSLHKHEQSTKNKCSKRCNKK